MAFKLNLILNDKDKQEKGRWTLDETNEVTLSTVLGPLQATFLPDGSPSEPYLSYTLTLDESGKAPDLSGHTGSGYEFTIDHTNTKGEVDESFKADGPHTHLIRQLSSNRLIAQLAVLEGTIDRAHLSLIDSSSVLSTAS